MARFDRMETSLQRPCQLRLGEHVEPRGLGQSRPRRGNKIGEKLLGVCFGRRAVDAQRVDNAALRVFELSCVPRGAGQSSCPDAIGPSMTKPTGRPSGFAGGTSWAR
jgi:hypothetical protein